MSEKTPLLIEPVIGYRAWLLEPHDVARPELGGRLISSFNGTTWATEMRATCQGHSGFWWGTGPADPKKRCKSPPGDDCGCGLYGMHGLRLRTGGRQRVDELAWAECLSISTASIHEQPGGKSRESFIVQLMLGVIAADGDLRVHHAGFRAERARIVALALGVKPSLRSWTAPFLECARATAENYGVPLVEPEELPAAAAKHGAPVPVHLRPSPEPSDFASSMSRTLSFAPPPLQHKHPSKRTLAFFGISYVIGWQTLSLIAGRPLWAWALVYFAMWLVIVAGEFRLAHHERRPHKKPPAPK